MYTRYDNSDREEYYEQFTFPKNIRQLNDWLTKTGEDDIFVSDKPIRFRNIEFGTSKKNIYHLYGKPRYIRNGNMFGETRHEILFYKELLNDNKLISQLHLIDDEFFLGCLTFRYIPKGRFYLIKNMLLEKYKSRDSNIILDSNNNQIRYVDDVLLHIIYLSGKEKIKTLMEGIVKKSSLPIAGKIKASFSEIYYFL